MILTNERKGLNYTTLDAKKTMIEATSIPEMASLSTPTALTKHVQTRLSTLPLVQTTTISHGKLKGSIFSRYNTKSGNIYKHGIGRIGNLMFQMASTLGIAASLSRKPFFSPAFEELFTLFPSVPHLNFMPADKYYLYKHSNSYRMLTEEKYGIYSKERFLVGKHLEHNIEVATYLQSYRYFEHIEQDIIHLFGLREDIKQKTQDILHGMLPNTASSQQQGKYLVNTFNDAC